MMTLLNCCLFILYISVKHILVPLIVFLDKCSHVLNSNAPIYKHIEHIYVFSNRRNQPSTADMPGRSISTLCQHASYFHR